MKKLIFYLAISYPLLYMLCTALIYVTHGHLMTAGDNIAFLGGGIAGIPLGLYYSQWYRVAYPPTITKILMFISFALGIGMVVTSFFI